MRQRPPPLLRLSAGAGPHDPGKDDERLRAAAPYMYSPSVRAPSELSVVAPFHDIAPGSFHLPPVPTSFNGRAQSAAAPLFAPMFRIGSRSKSPRRAASAMYGGSNAGNTASGKLTADMHPGSPVTIANMQTLNEPAARPFSPWGSTDSQSSTSPRNSTRMQKGVFTKRSLSPTASSVSGQLTSKSSRGFLGRGRKHSAQGLTDEFDPTTLRKNRSRPQLGAKGGDAALYHGYDDLFDDSLDDDMEEEDEGEETASEGGNEDEDGFFLLQIEEHPERIVSLQDSPSLSPKTRRISDEPPPRSVPSIPLTYTPHDRNTPPPPAPPPKSWRRSLVTTTPPHSSTPSVDEPLDDPTSTLSAPPTPPPKSAIPVLTIETNANTPERRRAERDTSHSPGPPPHNPPPATPPLRVKRFSKRLSAVGANKRRSVPDGSGLGIVNIPSPTLFSSEFSPDAGDTAWDDLAGGGHARSSPALTARSFTPRQSRAFGSGELSMGAHFDEADGVQSDPEFKFGEELPPLTVRKGSIAQQGGRKPSEAGTIRPRLQSLDAGRGGAPIISGKAVEHLLDSMISENDPAGRKTPSRETDDGEESSKEDVQEIEVKKNRTSIISREDMKTPTAEESAAKTAAATSDKSPENKDASKDEDDGKPDTAYLRAFKSILKTAGEADAFNYRQPRYDRVQAERICTNPSRNFPLGTTSPLRRGSKTRRNSRSRQEAAKEDIIINWYALMATRWLEFGKVITSPAHETLLAASVAHLKRRATLKMDRRATQMLNSVNEPGVLQPANGEIRRRVLDLGGLPVADWGWHCAFDYPKVKVYTVTQRVPKQNASGDTPSPTAPTHPQFRGPKNHRHLAVDRLCRLPFPPNHFDVVSARTLFLTLKTQAPSKTPGQTIDEYDRCLDECMRVLKPGGYLEFNLLDHEVLNAGPTGERLCTYFADSLRNRGFDPSPTKRWVARLNKAGFAEVKRAWLFLPMAPVAAKPKVPSKGEDGVLSEVDTATEEVRRKMEAWEEAGVKKGTLANVAPITGLVGALLWEKWLMEAGLSAEADVSVSAVVEEGKERGSGWRALIGWARKPFA